VGGKDRARRGRSAGARRAAVRVYGRVSTEDWQDPVTSRARQREQAQALVRGHGIIVAEFFDVGQSRVLAWAQRPASRHQPIRPSSELACRALRNERSGSRRPQDARQAVRRRVRFLRAGRRRHDGAARLGGHRVGPPPRLTLERRGRSRGARETAGH
jgi:hypothetical protein